MRPIPHSSPSTPRSAGFEPLLAAAPPVSSQSLTQPALIAPTAPAVPGGAVLGPWLDWVPRGRNYGHDAAYAAFRERALVALAALPDYPVTAVVYSSPKGKGAAR